MNKIYLIILATMLVLSGCYTHNINAPKSHLVEQNHAAGSFLIKDAGADLNKAKTIIAASFVNIDNLSHSSSFGRIASQQIATKFTNAGFNVVEILLSTTLIVQQQKGEFLLSRELQKISLKQSAQAVIVGTYAVGRNYVYITSKVIDAINSKTIASCDYKIPLDSDIKELLQ